MRILTTHAETNLTELARRLFKIEGKHAVAEERKAVAALRQANPSLRSGAALPEGAPVVAPDVEGLKRTSATAPAVSVSKELIKELRSGLESAGKAIDAAHAEQTKRDEAEIADLKSNSRQLSTAGPEVKKQIAAIQEAGRRRARQRAETRKLEKQDLGRLANDLDELLKNLR